MKIASVQLNFSSGNVHANMQKVERYIEKAALKECDVAVFPEMSDTGYNMKEIAKNASFWQNGPIEIIRRAARKFKIYVICGLSEKQSGKIYNSVAILDPDGNLIGKYRKTHLAAFSPLHEDKIFTAGSLLDTMQIGDWKWAIMICYDLRFPELCRSYAMKGVQAIALCSAWPLVRSRHWKTLIKARAVENQVFLVASNHVGQSGDVVFGGFSTVVDPFGNTIASAPQDKEAIIVGKMDKEKLDSIREAMPVFRHRRVDLY